MQFLASAMGSLGDRIRDAAAKVGGVDALSERIGSSRRTLYDYVSGRSEPKVSTALAIARACDVSLAWLVGDDRNGGAGGISSRYLQEALAIVEEWLDENDRQMKPAKKADVVAQIYQFIVEDVEEGRSPMDKNRARQILRLVA